LAVLLLDAIQFLFVDTE